MTDDASTAPDVAAVRSALAVVLAEVDPPGPWVLPSEVSGAGFAAAARRHRVATHLARGRRRLALPDDVDADLRDQDRTERLASLRLVRDLCRATEALTTAGVRYLVFKGAALAQQLYGDFAARGFGDIDVFVAPSDAGAAHEVLTAAGWRANPAWPQPGPSWVWRSTVRHYFSLPLSGEVDVDLQWRLHPVDRTAPTFAEAHDRRAVVEVAGHDVATLGRYDALAHSAAHAARDDWSWLRSLVDVHQLAADPGVWAAADRPLTGAELVSVGLAVRCFGRPDGVPPVVNEAVARSARWWSALEARQAGRPVSEPGAYLPGLGWLEAASRLLRAPADVRTAGDVLWGVVMRPDRLGGIDDPTMLGALPAVLERRASALGTQWRLNRLATPGAQGRLGP